MDKIKTFLIFVIILILVASGLASLAIKALEEVIQFIYWLFSIRMTDFGLLPSVEIIIKITTFVISYLLVGIFFNFLDLFESNLMKIAYFILSTIIGFILSYVIYIIQENITAIAIGTISLLILSIILYILLGRIRRNKDYKEMKKKIKLILEDTDCKLISFFRNYKAFGDMIVEISKGEMNHTFITDRGEVVFDNRSVISCKHNNHLKNSTALNLIEAIQMFVRGDLN